MKNLLFHAYRGSYVYNTYIEGISDKDEIFIYYEDLNNILSLDYKNQININKDNVGYELGRFIELLGTANPSMLEILFTPKDKIIYKHPFFDILLENKYKFLTKKCKLSFGGYAIAQIKKAKGLNKKIHWEKDKITRKTVLDFCYIAYQQGSICIKDYLLKNNLKQEYCGLISIPHIKNTYAVFYNENGDYKGIVSDETLSNNISLSSIPKFETPLFNLYFNHEGYSTHCREYKEYQDWLKHRNTNRYIETKNNQTLDSKNMLHCIRLITMCKEIAIHKELFVKRDDYQYLIDIRKGKYNLDNLLIEAENLLVTIDKLYENSTLPDDISYEFMNEMLINIRKQIYNI